MAPRDGAKEFDEDEIILRGRGLTEIPEHIFDNSQLRVLDISANQIRAIPDAISRLESLEILVLSRNQIDTLPDGISALKNLTTLDISRNDFTRVPAVLTELSRLQTLDLGHNKLKTVSAPIGRLTALQHLGLAANQLTSLTQEVASLANLVSLDLSGNKIRSLPKTFAQLTQLSTLDLGFNGLKAIPLQALGLPGLRHLELAGNQLVDLPPQLAIPTARGLILGLANNPLKEPLPELIEQGPEALSVYLRSLDEAVPQFEAKVILVGEGNVGKTSLLAALRHEPFLEGRPTTHGIEIHEMSLQHPQLSVDMAVRFWDFGGQEVYRITHQFFFSRRALFVVVWNAREGQEQDEVEGWLRRIRLRVGDDCRVVLVATHCDERNAELDFVKLQKLFPRMLLGRHAVDSRTNEGIEELREELARHVSELPHMGNLLSPRWAAARDEILARAAAEPQITYAAFLSVCAQKHVVRTEAAALARLMHDLGQVVYYGEDEGLRDIVVLNPEWLTKAIGYVLEDGPTRNNGGLLDHRRLRQIWLETREGQSYPTRHHPYFLRLMEKFDISYRTDSEEGSSLVAQLVPHDQPSLPWDLYATVRHGVRRLSLVCQLSEPVPGLIAWLTVRHHRASTGRHWRRGVFLQHPVKTYESQALIELVDEVRLVLDVRAPSPDLFFNVLRDSIEDLLTRRWPGLQFELHIPCPTRRASQTCTGKFPLIGLLRYRERGGMTVPCLQCDAELDVSQLLTGFSVPAMSLQPQLEDLQHRLANVASAVERVERFAADTSDSVRRVLKAASTEVADCPRLFTLAPEAAPLRSRIKIYERRFRLTLWCEHPGEWHPVDSGSYSLHQDARWFARMAPYINLVFKTLRIAVPIVVGVAGIVVPADRLDAAREEVELMRAVVEQLPGLNDELDLPFEGPQRLTFAEGDALRALRALLLQNDPARRFGGLRRVMAVSGDFVWVCGDHYGQYDPGLPRLPE